VTHPDRDDLVIRQKYSDPSTFLLGTGASPDQIIVSTRGAAVSHGLAYAKHHRVRAWFAKDDGDFVLLGTRLA
jgi:hypothetical protein